MDFSAAIGCGFFLFFLFLTCAFYFQRLRWKRNKRLGKKNLGFCPSLSSLGNALQRAQQFAQPQAEIVMLEEDAAEEGEEEIAENGVKHLHHQLKQVRNGDKIDKLIVLLRLWR